MKCPPSICSARLQWKRFVELKILLIVLLLAGVAGASEIAQCMRGDQVNGFTPDADAPNFKARVKTGCECVLDRAHKAGYTYTQAMAHPDWYFTFVKPCMKRAP